MGWGVFSFLPGHMGMRLVCYAYAHKMRSQGSMATMNTIPLSTCTQYVDLTYHRLGNFRVAFFRVKNVHMFNFRHVAKWQKLNARVRNFGMFNFRRLSNWQRIFNGKNFPIYGISSLHICCKVANNFTRDCFKITISQ